MIQSRDMLNKKKNNTPRNLALGFLAILLIALLTYQLPLVKSRLGWRIDAWWTGVRMVLNPAGEIPTPVSDMATSAATAEPIFPTATPIPPTLTPAPSPTFIPSPTAIPASVRLDAPRWEKQDWNNCGPTTLTLYLRYYGWEGDQFTISDTMKPERADRNVNVEELDHYTRNNAGWLNTIYRVGGNVDLLKQLLAAGIPVMIEEGDELEQAYWPDDDQWAGHYLMLSGYDDAAQHFIAQDSYRGTDRIVPYAETDERWQAFNRVYILVYPPNMEETVRAILGEDWDANVNRQNALDAAQAEIDANSTDAYAWFNLGSNLVYFERYGEAAQAYDEARQLGLPQRMLRYQFGPFFAYFHTNRMDDLKTLVDYALQITKNSEEALVWQGWAYYRMGEDNKAIDSFRESYWANPTSLDAKYALDFMGASP